MSDSLQKRNGENSQNGLSRFEYIPSYSLDHEHRESNSLDPKKIIGILLRYKWVVLLFLIAGATGAWFYADSIAPQYESQGTLMINTSGASSDDELSKIISQTTGVGTSSTLQNELQVLQSREFSRKVARSLIEEDPGDINTFPLLWTEDEETGEISRVGEATVAARIQSGLSFRQLEREADVVEVSFTSASPEEAEKVVDEVMEIYVETSTQQNRQAAESTANFLEEEQQELKQRLEESEERLERFMDETGIVQVDNQASNMIQQRTETESELQRVNLDLQTIEQAISNHESQLERIKPGLSEQFSEAVGPRIRNAQEELARYEGERTLIISKNPGVLERDPLPSRMQYLDEQISRLKGEIKELSDQLFTEDDEYLGMDSEQRAEMVSTIQTRLVELQIEKNQNESRRDALVQHKNEMDSNFNSLPEGMVELAKLQRDVRINEELYSNISRQHADMAVLQQSQFGFGRIVDSPVLPNAPVSPNKKMLLLLGIMLGGFFAAGFIVIREFMDNSVNSAEQLRYSSIPVLSSIPRIQKVSARKRNSFSVGNGKVPNEIVLLQDRSNLVSESIRRLKNNIIYQHGHVPPKTISVTSAEKGDGKSTIVSNLGIAFAEEGYKTLLIDADFRRPKLHKYFGLTDSGGLTDYLYGDLPSQKLIQNSDVNALKIITAGKSVEKPEIIGNSKAFRKFLKEMEGVFDVIILDTPPFGIISDSTALLKNTKATLVVVKYRKTNKGMFLRTLEELGRIQANLTGIVLNDFDHRKETGSYYGAGYYQALYSNYEDYIK